MRARLPKVDDIGSFGKTIFRGQPKGGATEFCDELSPAMLHYAGRRTQEIESMFGDKLDHFHKKTSAASAGLSILRSAEETMK